jgi:hypothetical protein
MKSHPHVTPSVLAAVAALLATTCVQREVAQPRQAATESLGTAATTEAPTLPRLARPAFVHLSDELVRVCPIRVEHLLPPKAGPYKDDLVDSDRTALDEVVTCVTTGPLKGRTLQLVGHAERGNDAEYEFPLGEPRVDEVKDYLGERGVPLQSIDVTSFEHAVRADQLGQRYRRVDVEVR